MEWKEQYRTIPFEWFPQLVHFLHQQSASFPAHQLPEPGLTATATGFGGAKTLSTSKSIEILPE